MIDLIFLFTWVELIAPTGAARAELMTELVGTIENIERLRTIVNSFD